MQRLLSYVRSNPFLLDSSIMIGSGVFLGVLNYFFSVVMVHVLPLSSFGQFQVYTNLIALLSVVGGAITPYMIRMSAYARYGQDNGNEERGFTILFNLYRQHRYLIIGTLGLFVAVMLLIASYFVTFSIGHAFFIIVGVVLFTILAGIFSGIMQGIKAFFHFTCVNITSVLIKIVVAAGVAWITKSPGAALLGLAVSQMVSFYFFQKKVLKEFSSSVQSANIKDIPHTLLYDILYTFLFSILLSFVSNGDMLISQSILDGEMLGFMGVFVVVGKMILFANIAMMGVVMPYVAQAKDRYALRQVVRFAYLLILAISLVGILGFLLLPHIILEVLFHMPANSFLEPILWQTGCVAALLSLLTLEATISYARKIPRFIPLFFGIVGVFILLVYGYGSNVPSLMKMIGISHAVGWLLLVSNRLLYTWRKSSDQLFTKREKTLQSGI